MRRTTSKVSAFVLVVLLSTGLLATPASAMQREGPRRDDPIVRVIKQLLKRFGISTNADELSVPRP